MLSYLIQIYIFWYCLAQGALQQFSLSDRANRIVAVIFQISPNFQVYDSWCFFQRLSLWIKEFVSPSHRLPHSHISPKGSHDYMTWKWTATKTTEVQKTYNFWPGETAGTLCNWIMKTGHCVYLSDLKRSISERARMALRLKSTPRFNGFSDPFTS